MVVVVINWIFRNVIPDECISNLNLIRPDRFWMVGDVDQVCR